MDEEVREVTPVTFFAANTVPTVDKDYRPGPIQEESDLAEIAHPSISSRKVSLERSKVKQTSSPLITRATNSSSNDSP